MTTLLGIDVSNHQGLVDFAAVKRAGYAFVFLKATEGVGFTDGMFATDRAKARAAGLVVGAYHFSSAGDPIAEANAFCAVVGSLTTGDLVVLDWETSAPNPPAWCKAWLDRVSAILGVKPLIYLNQTERDGFDWTPVVSGDYGLWIAQYDGNQSVPASGKWPTVALKQDTSSGSVPGVAGGVDVDVFYGDANTLAAYGYQGDTMPTAQEIAQAVWMQDIGGVHARDRLQGMDSIQLPKLAAAVAKIPATAPVTVDAVALAAALLADPAGVDRLGAAIAAHLKLTSG
jgi:GH25 family lysozyme M1 (1,4-beta-N-acetylmuramidase)